MGQNRAYMAVLCAVLYSGNINRRQYRFLFLKQLQRMKLLTKFQQALGTQVYDKVKQAESSLKQ